MLVVTTGVRDAHGNAIGVAEGFSSFRRDLAHDSDRYYRRALLTAKWAVGRVTGRDVEVAALSVFTTQTATHIVERMREEIYAAPAPTLDFTVGPGGERAVFADRRSRRLHKTPRSTSAARSRPRPSPSRSGAGSSGAVGTVAFGTYRALDFTEGVSGHVAPIPTRTGTLAAPARSKSRSTRLATGRHAGPRRLARSHLRPRLVRQKEHGARIAAIAAEHGLATITINALGRGWGPRTTMTVRRIDGTTMTFAAPGLGRDQNGDNVIDDWEPRRAPRPNLLHNQAGPTAAAAAQHFALVRALRAGASTSTATARRTSMARASTCSASRSARKWRC